MNGRKNVRFRRLGRASPFGAALILILLASCENPQEPEERQAPTLLANPLQVWSIDEFAFDEAFNRMDVKGDVSKGGVDGNHQLGSTFTPPIPDEDGVATAEVFATESGSTFWVSAQAPNGNFAAESVVGGTSELVQYFSFRKDSPNASLRFTITALYQELLDHNLAFPLSVCTWYTGTPISEAGDICRDVINTAIDVAYNAYTADPDYIDDFPGGLFFKTTGRASIRGFSANINLVRSKGFGYRDPGNLFSGADFHDERVNGDIRHLITRLNSPITIDVPLEAIAVGTVFNVTTSARARAWTRRRNESYAAAYFRDPLSLNGGELIEYSGLTPLEAPSSVPEHALAIPPAVPCEAAAGGTIQFQESEYFKPEWPGDDGDVAEITIAGTAVGGEASALLTTGGGSATPGSRDATGSDYEPVSTHVWFAAGESGTRTVYVPIIGDQEPEDNETIVLTLSDPRGCAELGSATTATLTIRDDDQPIAAEETWTIGGTVTGLEGSGLVLTNNLTDDLQITSDGSFVFGRAYADGVVYNVRVDTQPDEPAQLCTVANGSGTVAGADVTDIEVSCETLSPTGASLDPTFGNGGKATLEVGYTGVLGSAPDVALQTDGRVVAVSGNLLARFNVDGSLDAGFGSGGVVTVDFYGSRDRLHAVAVQPDGQIVVAGYSIDGVNSPVQEDIIIARYNADGTLDTSFGNGGEVVTDFEAHADAAHDLIIQPDGRIIVTGSAATIDEGGFGVYYSDFAAARYTPAGELDDTFGNGGRASTSLDQEMDASYGSALQADGKLVLAGRIGVADSDIGVVRYNSDGSLDPSFGNGGILRNLTSRWDEAADVAVQPDGRILVVGFTLHEGGILNDEPDTLTVERFNSDGTYDATFGTGGRARVPHLAPGRAVALQPDGGILVAAVDQGGESADWALTRFTPTGELDTSFGTDGVVRVDFFGQSDFANAVVVQPDGNVVVAGSVTNGASSLLGLIRVVP